MSRVTVILLAAALTTLLGGARVARADQHLVYEWTDAHGEVHYTDQWVPGAKLVTIDTAHASAADSAAMQGIENEGSAASSGIKQEQDAQAVQEDEDKARAERCTQEKAVYQKLIQSRRIYTTDKSGQRHYLSDADADAARLSARQAMEADCGS